MSLAERRDGQAVGTDLQFTRHGFESWL